MIQSGETYWRQIGRHGKPLSRATELDLDRELIALRTRLAERPDDERAKQALVRLRNRYVLGTLRYAIALANRYRGPSELDDAIQEASVGLMVAFEKYDPTRGVRFITYARWWMRAQLESLSVRNRSAARVPRQAGQIVRDVQKRGGVAVGKREDHVMRAMQVPMSLDDQPVPPPEIVGGADVVERAVDCRRLRARVEERLGELGARERDIMRRRLGLDAGEGETLQEIAATYGLSRERVRQLAKQGSDFLHEALAP